MGATHVQCGVVNHRINREPLDAESVIYSYSYLQSKLQMRNATQTIDGALYAGMVTSVINDENSAYNGPWYISYAVSNGTVSYSGDRIPTKTEMNSYVGSVKTELEKEVDDMVFTWGHLT